MPPMTGRVVAGRYNLQHPIGRGAMGVVWRARDQLLDRDVAVKEVVISALIGADERRMAYQRTLREARTAARLSHRGVVAIYDVAEEDGRPWIIMELVPSRSLDQVLTVERRLTPLRAGRIGQQLLSALAAAHLAGVLHRDVKPSNVLIATDRSGSGWDERAVLTDFGIAQFEGDPRLTQTGMVMGSPGFTAPERIRGGDATPASDLWSLGATLYAAAEGRGPYEQRGGAITTMSAIINEDAPIAAHAGPLGAVIAALMRREPSARPSTSTAARMFAQVLPQLTEIAEPAERPREATHAATVRSAAVPAPSAAELAPADEPASGLESGAGVSGVAVSGVAAAGRADQADGSDDTDAADPAAPEATAEQDAAAGSRPAEDPAREALPEPEPATARAQAQAPAPAEASSAWETPASDAWGPPSDAWAMAAQASPAAEAPGDLTGADDAAADSTGAGSTEGDGAEEAGAAAAAGVTLLDATPGSRAGKTVIDRKPAGAAGAGEYRPTELALPVVKPATGRPTFTASDRGERGTPTFSAARQDRSGTAEADARPTYGAPQADAAKPGPYLGSTAPFAGSAGQYAGPSQPVADLASQYPPGRGGGRAQRRPGRWRWIVPVLCAMVLAAAIGAGIAYALGRHPAANGAGATGGATASSGASTAPPDPATGIKSVDALNRPSTALPAGWMTKQVTAATAKSKAGFSIDVPPGWTEQRQGLATIFDGPDGMVLEIDLTPHRYQNMVQEAKYIARRSAPKFTGYQVLRLEGEPVRSTDGALWQFKRTSGGVTLTADDILFIKPTAAGSQSYAVYLRGPSDGWGTKYLTVFDKILPTFQTLPAS